MTWNIAEALKFIRELEGHLEVVGFSCGVLGSVLHRGNSDNDLDIVVYPRNSTEVSYKLLRTVLVFEMGLTLKCPRHIMATKWAEKGHHDRKNVEKWETRDGRLVDIFYMD